MRAKVSEAGLVQGARIEKVSVVATSKKTSPAKSKSAKSKPADAKIDDAVSVDEAILSAPLEDQPEVMAEPAPQDMPADQPAATQDDEKIDTPESQILDDTQSADTQNTTAQMVHPVPAKKPDEKKGNAFLPLVLGGIIAGAIGFIAGQNGMLGANDADITNKLRSDLNAQQERIAALETAPQPSSVAPAVDLSQLEGQLDALETRLAALEQRPAGMAGSAELEALQSSIETQRSEIQSLLDTAKTVEEATADAAKAATLQAAIAKIVSAIDAGQPFTDALSELKSLELSEIDPALEAAAENGVTTLSALQADFPDQARTALATARANGVGDGQQGLGGFLKRSLGARSVAPREGNDPDAVLSRAEAAINTGDLQATLAELDTLPEEAQAAIADWRAAADARLNARAAADALSQRPRGQTKE